MASGAAAGLALPPLQQARPVETGSWLLTCSVAERMTEENEQQDSESS